MFNIKFKGIYLVVKAKFNSSLSIYFNSLMQKEFKNLKTTMFKNETPLSKTNSHMYLLIFFTFFIYKNCTVNKPEANTQF